MTVWIVGFLHRAALRLLPPHFRARWSAELSEVMRDRLRGEGVAGALRDVAAVMVTGVRLRARRLVAARSRKGAILPMFRGSILDIRAVVRSLRRQPAYALAAVCTIAVGVGAATALFGVYDQVVVQPLPHVDANRLYMLWRELPEYDIARAPSSYPTFADIVENVSTFESIAAYTSAAMTVAAGGEPERIRGARVTGALLPLLGNAPVRGRVITSPDDEPGAEPVIVLSYGLWQRQFGGSDDAVGRLVRVGETPHRVIGVMPPDFTFPSLQSEFWVPLQLSVATTERDTHRFSVIARLGSGASVEQAAAQLDALYGRLETAYPDVYTGRMWLERRQDFIVGDTAGVLRALLWAALFLAVAGAANFAGLLLVRAAARRREAAVALALRNRAHGRHRCRMCAIVGLASRAPDERERDRDRRGAFRRPRIASHAGGARRGTDRSGVRAAHRLGSLHDESAASAERASRIRPRTRAHRVRLAAAAEVRLDGTDQRILRCRACVTARHAGRHPCRRHVGAAVQRGLREHDVHGRHRQ